MSGEFHAPIPREGPAQLIGDHSAELVNEPITDGVSVPTIQLDEQGVAGGTVHDRGHLG